MAKIFHIGTSVSFVYIHLVGACFKLFLLQMTTFTMTSNGEKFPRTLEGFGYAFNKEGKLRKICSSTGQPGDEPFQFSVSEDHSFSQRHYEALGEVITDYVYGLLENDLNLHRLDVPQSGSGPKSFIFATEDALQNPDKLLLLIHGSGVVRAGQWARSLIINDSLQTGTQIPYIKKAIECGYGVIIFNTNDNTREIDGKEVKIKGSRDPKEHADYVWKHYVKESKAKHIAIVAHSYGGVVTVDLAINHFSDFQDRVFAIALTDSVHSFQVQKSSSKVVQYLQKVSRNWVAEDEPLDTPIPFHRPDIERISAGHPRHEMTSSSSIDSVFKFLEERYRALKKKDEL
ncbi:FAM172 family protein homolog CG10038 [Schistocerca cancellata]|uniref:FAM172 family protein homolog CG10038 n=1 Tax=Schistocerca cancellata TaxID=274614 RepID=UPI0021194EC9|nr:FAM172 family protein homolog CG10038 [Schistocerca cancellata]